MSYRSSNELDPDLEDTIRPIINPLVDYFTRLEPDPALTYSRNHMWFIQQTPHSWRAGLDLMASRTISQVTEIIFPSYQGSLSRASPLLWIYHLDSMIVLRSPTQASALHANRKLRDCPSLLLADPQGEGWLLEGEFQIEQEQTYLIPKQALAGWFQQEVEWFIKEIKMQLIKQLNQPVGETLSDGGQYVTDICSALGPVTHHNLLQNLMNLI
ncbi:MAG: hypothetical protein JSW54_12290 [Fidelibacterota bacterium]|nr:MAG: hypothetical protein JSW54_12290 [Candidatus Neomarinimicrobiota bacterium]